MKEIFIILFIALTGNHILNAQGCVAVRQMGGVGMCTSNAYNLSKVDLQVGANYRYFHSWRHFVGSKEQPQRQALGNAVNIFSHAADLNLSYGLTNRLQLNVTLPYVHNRRSQTVVLNKDTSRGSLTRYGLNAQGIGDVRLGLNYWVTDPA